jgi:hypothetical protein
MMEMGKQIRLYVDITDEEENMAALFTDCVMMEF